jgi:hypothetical protein
MSQRDEVIDGHAEGIAEHRGEKLLILEVNGTKRKMLCNKVSS